MSDRPVQEIRIGVIRATIWLNVAKRGDRYSIVITKLYKAADRWDVTSHFSRNDLPLVSRVAELAHTWIAEQRQRMIVPTCQPDVSQE